MWGHLHSFRIKCKLTFEVEINANRAVKRDDGGYCFTEVEEEELKTALGQGSPKTRSTHSCAGSPRGHSGG